MDIKLLELALVAGAAFGLGFWQLYDVDKALKDERDRCDDPEGGSQGDRTSSDSNSASTSDSRSDSRSDSSFDSSSDSNSDSNVDSNPRH